MGPLSLSRWQSRFPGCLCSALGNHFTSVIYALKYPVPLQCFLAQSLRQSSFTANRSHFHRLSLEVPCHPPLSLPEWRRIRSELFSLLLFTP